ncbi:heavy metal-associated domain-containing protein [Cohaesibacter sp. CAU 1516]|uniref:heavy-metal-associated domain-containing protein n=1 Tax=Cohaesibacter sp. CAU 1516 TaxID=2576038 RepID=UPI001AEF2F8B|nr:heavy metal-associated domain-containing protein [Cohaesibacter sp. CAU 1516]
MAKFRHLEATSARTIMTQSLNGIFQLQDMACGNCAQHAEDVALTIEGVSHASVDLSTQTISLSFEHPTEESLLVEAFDKIGFSAVTPRTELSITGMHCSHCVSTIEKALKAMPGVLTVEISLATEKATITFWQGRTDPEALAARVTELGFPAQPV